MKFYQCSRCDKSFEAESGAFDKTVLCPHCGHLLVLPSTDLLPGTILGGFEIAEKIGEGGMGNVYLAKQISMGRRVALKVLSKEYSSDKDIIKQFKKEVQFSGQLNHPYIVKAIDAGEDGDFYYMAITFVDGEDYERILSKEIKIPEGRALEVIMRVADALSYAWDKHNLIHSDVKPGNIMTNKKGEVFLMDLGIAQSFDLRKKKNKKEILGSPFYISPEQAQGLNLDWRTDLYSLGATLYHMVVGVPLYDAKEIEAILEMHVNAAFPDPNKRTPSPKLSQNTVKLLRKMLAKKPDERFASWTEFIASANASVKTIVTGNAGINVSSKLQTKRLATSSKSNLEKTKSNQISASNILVIVLIFVAIILFGVILYKMNKNSIAWNKLQSAENYLLRSRNNYEGALGLFEDAAAFSKNTRYHAMAVGRYVEIKELLREREGRLRDFDQKIDEAQIKATKKLFDEALEILDRIKNIDDNARRKNAEILIDEIQKQKIEEIK